MNQRDMAGYLGVATATIRNWRKEKPNLYKTIMLGIRFQDLIDESKSNYENLLKFSKEIDEEIERFKK